MNVAKAVSPDPLPDRGLLIEHPAACLLWALEDALAQGDFASANSASDELRAIGVEVRLLPRGHGVPDRAARSEGEQEGAPDAS
jgi:hypothetical protein